MSRERRPRGARRSRYQRGPTEGGSGGKRGHSNMEHYALTAEIKEGKRRRRRAEDKEIARKGAAEYDEHAEEI